MRVVASFPFSTIFFFRRGIIHLQEKKRYKRIIDQENVHNRYVAPSSRDSHDFIISIVYG